MSGTVILSAADAAQLNADIGSIGVGGALSATATSYIIELTNDLLFTAPIAPISLATGDVLTIEGANAGNDRLTAQIDGDGAFPGFTVSAGVLDLSNLSLTGLVAAGGTHSLSGGGAIFVGASGTVNVANVNFSGDVARGGTAAGGAVFVAPGGSFSLTGGAVSGSGNSPGNAFFIQGNNAVTLANTTITGAIADAAGAGLGAGAGTVITEGSVTLSSASHYTGGTEILNELTLLDAQAAGTGAISFSATQFESLSIASGAVPLNVIAGFAPGPAPVGATADFIDFESIGAPASVSLVTGNHLTVAGASAIVTLALDPAQNYAADSFILASDGMSGTTVEVVQAQYMAASETALNSAISAIDLGGTASAPDQNYVISLTADVTLGTNLLAINLAAGDTLTILGGGHTLDGAAVQRGFFDYAGNLELQNITIANAVALGGAGGAGALPGGGGAGLGGGLFVASGAAANLQDVTFLNDAAIGGAGGAPGGKGIGGGGGLGGAGGAGAASGSLLESGGGGGIGLGADGGSSAGPRGGGAGIVQGAAGGLGGTGNTPAAGAGGGAGGGGGAGTLIRTGGSGRGGGGSRTIEGAGGAGGIGGAFGGGGADGAGGFGGGGGDGAGGFGGGGSNGFGSQFGGGSGTGAGGGGGLGAGGGVFVQQGGVLSIGAGGISFGSVTGGAGSGGGGAGRALGSGIFSQGSNEITLAPGLGQSLSIGDVIADTAGAGGTGATGLVLDGGGSVTLAASNAYAGGTTLHAGTLILAAAGAAGSGPIYFAYGGTPTLVARPGDVPGNIISGFLPGEVIDLQGIGTASNAVLGGGDRLTIAGGALPVTLALDPAQNFTGESFTVTGDGAGGTLLRAVDFNNDLPPNVSGTGSLIGDDHTPLDPFAGVTISALIAGQTETLSVSFSATGNGGFSNLGGGVYNASSGIYSVIGSAASVTGAIEQLIFTPTEHQVAPGQSVVSTFTISATDGTMTSTAAASTLTVTALNDAPVISGVNPSTIYGYWTLPLNPFSGTAITDPDVGAVETATLTVAPITGIAGDASGTLALDFASETLTETAPGHYTLSAGTPAELSAALNAMTFTPNTTNPSAGFTDTEISLSVSDGIAPPVLAAVNVNAGLPVYTGIMAGQTAADGQPVVLFSGVTVSDSPGLSIQSFAITVYDSNSNYTIPTDSNGTLSGAGLTEVSTGVYTLVPGNTTLVTSELDALVFTPANGSTATTYFYLQAFDGATTSGNADTSVTAIACFAAGTRILTAGGRLVAVEDLRAGDMLETFDGQVKRIIWLGRRSLDLRRHPRPLAAQPILITAGALGGGLPLRDLVVSPDHGMYLAGKLIPAKALTNGFTIRQLNRRRVTYYHIELAEHAVIFAEGAAAESYLETGNRGAFENGGPALVLHPDFAQTLRETKGCAPFFEHGPAVEAVRQRILDHAQIATTGDPGLHISYENGAAIIESRTAVPGELTADPRDKRRLGVKIAAIRAGRKSISLDHPALREGWHELEPDGRWTNGRAVIPKSLIGRCGSIKLTLAGSLAYARQDSSRQDGMG